MDCSSEQLLKSVKASLCSSLGVVLKKNQSSKQGGPKITRKKQNVPKKKSTRVVFFTQFLSLK